jgi:inosine-uridine nucleoside N-ribohydrolase
MVGLDVTQRAMLTRAERDSLADDPSPEAVLVREVTRFIFEQRQLERVVLHDALAVAVAIEPGLVTTIERTVAVETRGEHTFGQTVVDLRSTVQGGSGSGHARVCMDVDVDRFKRVLFSEALGLNLG